jgi:hypothetical protein
MRDVNNALPFIEEDFQKRFVRVVEFVSGVYSTSRGQIDIRAYIDGYMSRMLDKEIAEKKSILDEKYSSARVLRESHPENVRNADSILKALLPDEWQENDGLLELKNEDNAFKEEKDALASAEKRKEEILAMLAKRLIIVEKTPEHSLSCRYVLNPLSGEAEGHDAQSFHLFNTVIRQINDLGLKKEENIQSPVIVNLINLPKEIGPLFQKLYTLLQNVFTESLITEALLGADDLVPILLLGLPNDLEKLGKLKQSLEKLDAFINIAEPLGLLVYEVGSMLEMVKSKLKDFSKEKEDEHFARDLEAGKLPEKLNMKKQALMELTESIQKAKNQPGVNLDEMNRSKEQLLNEIWCLSFEIHRNEFNKVLGEISELDLVKLSGLNKKELFFTHNMLKLYSYFDERKRNATVLDSIFTILSSAENVEKKIIAAISSFPSIFADKLSNEVKLEIKYILFNINLCEGEKVIEVFPSAVDNRLKQALPGVRGNNRQLLEAAYQRCLEQLMKVSNLGDVQKEIKTWASAAVLYQNSKSEPGIFKKKDPVSRREITSFLEGILNSVDISHISIDENKPSATVLQQLRNLQLLYKVHLNNNREIKTLNEMGFQSLAPAAVLVEPQGRGASGPKHAAFSEGEGAMAREAGPVIRRHPGESSSDEEGDAMSRSSSLHSPSSLFSAPVSSPSEPAEQDELRARLQNLTDKREACFTMISRARTKPIMTISELQSAISSEQKFLSLAEESSVIRAVEDSLTRCKEALTLLVSLDAEIEKTEQSISVVDAGHSPS